MSRLDILVRDAAEWSVHPPTTRGGVGRPAAAEADVLLVGVSADEHLDVIGREVRSRGATVSTIHTDVDFAGGLNLALRPPAEVCVEAVLWRPVDLALAIPHHGRRTFVSVDPFDRDSALHGHAHREAAAAAQCWSDLIEAPMWVNAPWASRRAESKALQLRVAHRNHLNVPRTIITADVAALATFAEECGGVVIHKVLDHPMTQWSGSTGGFMPTSSISSTDVARFGAGLPYAALFQERLFPRAEHRVVVVGECVIAARVDRADAARPDWRLDLESGRSTFSPTRLDPEVEASLVAVMAELGLAYGAVDLLETVDGVTYFLEVNPVGSYRWLEVMTGLRITGVLVDHLLSRCG